MILIDKLAYHLDLVKPVAEWCCSAWPWYYDNGNLEVAINYHLRTAATAGIPCALVALDKKEIIGTIALLEDDMDIRSNVTPWLGCLYVVPSYRDKGIASLLIAEGLKLAFSQKIPEIFAWTEKLGPALRKAGWKYLEIPLYQGKQVDIFSIEPGSSGANQSNRAAYNGQ